MRERYHLDPDQLEPYLLGAGSRRDLIPIEGKAPRVAGWKGARFPAKAMRHRLEAGKGNVGFRLSEKHLIIDVDWRNDPEGRNPDELLRAVVEKWRIDPRAIVKTGSGGYHAYLLKPPELRIPRYLPELGRGIEFKSGPGQQVVAAGSTHPETGQTYQWTDATRLALDLCDSFDGEGFTLVPRAPGSLLRQLARGARAQQADLEGEAPSDLDVDEVRDALACIDNVPRDSWLTIGFALHSTEDVEARRLWDDWSMGAAYRGWPMQRRTRCAVSEYWDYSDEAQEAVWSGADSRRPGGVTLGTLYQLAAAGGWSRNVYRSRQRPSAREEFADLPQDEEALDPSLPAGDPDAGLEDPTLEAYLDRLNQRFAILPGRYPQVANVERDPLLFYGKEAAFWALNEFRPCFEVGGRSVPAGEVWAKHPQTRRYSEVTFDPGREPELGRPWRWTRRDRTPALNLWRGWAVEPRQGPESLYRPYLAHIEDIVCCGCPDRFNWLMSWIAWFFQRPGEKPQVAVVLRGKQGIGKGVFAQGLLRIAGGHGLQVTRRKGLTGDFNAHLSGKKLVYGDEILWGGHRDEAGTLKTLITEEVIEIEPKGQNKRFERSYHGFLLASNERWVVPAEEDARRFTVLDVSDRHRRDRGYFDRVRAASKGAALQAFLWEVLNTVRPGEDPWPNPLEHLPTAGLLEQQVASMDGFDRWLLDALQDGTLSDVLDWPEEGSEDLDYANDPRRWVRKHDVYLSYAEHAGKVGNRRVEMQMEVMKRLREAFGRIPESRVRSGPDGARERRIRLPSLREARAAMNRTYGQDLFRQARRRGSVPT